MGDVDSKRVARGVEDHAGAGRRGPHDHRFFTEKYVEIGRGRRGSYFQTSLTRVSSSEQLSRKDVPRQAVAVAAAGVSCNLPSEASTPGPEGHRHLASLHAVTY